MGGQPSKDTSVASVLQREDPEAVNDLLKKWRITPLDLLRPLTAENIASLRVDQEVPSVDAETHKEPKTADVSERTPFSAGDTPLHLAAELNNAQILRAMVKAVLAYRGNHEGGQEDSEERQELPKLDWDVRDANGLSPLSRAVRKENVIAIQLLINAGADSFQPYCTSGPTSDERWAYSYLRYAAWGGKMKVLNALLSVKDICAPWGDDGKRAIHLAIENGQLSVVEVLLQQDLDQYFDDGCELTSEYKAIARSLSVKRFIVRAPTVGLSRHCGTSTRRERQRSGDTSDRRALPGASFEPAAPAGLLEILRGALQTELESLTTLPQSPDTSPRNDHRAPPQANGGGGSAQNSRDRGSSLLHLAATYGHTPILEYLLDHPAFSESYNALNEFGKSPIFMAVRHGHLECLKCLQSRGVSLKATDIENWSIVHEAVKYKHIEILSYIIAHGGDANVDDDDGWTPVHVAARFNVWSAIAPLVAAGADINAKTEDNQTPLQLTVMQNNNEETLKELLRFNPDVSHIRDAPSSPERLLLERRDFSMLTILLEHLNKKRKEHGGAAVSFNRVITDSKTLLHRCVAANATDAVKNLLQMGADDAVHNSLGETVLFYAARKDMQEMVRVLLANNANPDAPHRNGTRPLHAACDVGHSKVVQHLLSHGAEAEGKVPPGAPNAGFTGLMLAARRGHRGVIDVLLRFRVALDEQKADGYTALHLAALNGHVHALDALLRGGADAGVAEGNGFLPLHVAVRNQQFDATAALLSCGADAGARGSAGLIALHFAAHVCDSRATWLLLQCGTATGAVDENGATALHYAARQPRGQSCLQLLLTSGASADARDADGDAPLHAAAQAGILPNVRILLKRGADPRAANAAGLTPLHAAVAQGSETVVAMLLRFGADGGLRDRNGTSAYQLATMARGQKARILIWRAIGLTAEDIAPVVKYAEVSREKDRAGGGSAGGDEGGEEGSICVVCQNELKNDEDVRKLPCGHTYHAECIMGWWGGRLLMEHQTCPLCNASVLPADLPAIPRTGI